MSSGVTGATTVRDMFAYTLTEWAAVSAARGPLLVARPRVRRPAPAGAHRA